VLNLERREGLSMKNLMLTVLLSSVAVYRAPLLHAQGNETVQATVKARSASGTVYGGRREEGYLLKDVRISQCDAKFQSCTDVAKTNQNGEYTLPGQLARLKVVYLEFLFPAYNELRLIVRVHRGAPKLAVVLPVGE